MLDKGMGEGNGRTGCGEMREGGMGVDGEEEVGLGGCG